MMLIFSDMDRVDFGSLGATDIQRYEEISIIYIGVRAHVNINRSPIGRSLRWCVPPLPPLQEGSTRRVWSGWWHNMYDTLGRGSSSIDRVAQHPIERLIDRAMW